MKEAACKIFVSMVATFTVVTAIRGTYDILHTVDKVIEPSAGVGRVAVVPDIPSEPEERVPEVAESLVSLGDFRLTAYCPCPVCCGEWAEGRPVDMHGNEIVYTASGDVAVSGKTIAGDPAVIPFGTEVIIGGNTYTAADSGGAIDGNRIDVYMDDHADALAFGVQYATVYVKEDRYERE